LPIIFSYLQSKLTRLCRKYQVFMKKIWYWKNTLHVLIISVS